MGTWIVAGNKDIIKLSNSAFTSLASTIEAIIQKSNTKYTDNLLRLTSHLNELGTHYVDLDEYFLNAPSDIYDFIDLVKIAIKAFESNPYWNSSNGQNTLHRIVENLEAYSVLINNNLKS